MTHLAPVAAFSAAERNILRGMLTKAVNAPLTTSAGRLFDAFAALTGLRQRASYEGQAAMQLEGAAGERTSGGCYPFRILGSACAPVRSATAESLVVDWQPTLEAALADIEAGAEAGAISEKLHNGLAVVIAQIAARVAEPHVVLTGGCFQNARLTCATVASLHAAGVEPFWHQRIPPNDGGIALGQAVWAAWAARRGEEPCA
jgi:hydrogenase maturation protein HypF